MPQKKGLLEAAPKPVLSKALSFGWAAAFGRKAD
jgi:hypothetical protein